MLSPKGLARRWTILIAGDAGCSAFSSLLAMRATLNPSFALASSVGFGELAAMMAAVHLGAIYLQDLYRFDEPRADSWTTAALLIVAAKLAVIVGVVEVAAPALAVGRTFLIVYVTIASICVIGWRTAANRMLLERLNVRVMALGFDEAAPLMIQEIERRRHLGYQFLGFAALDGGATPSGAAFGGANSLCELTRRCRVDTLVVLDSFAGPDETQELMRCRMRGTRLLDFETFYERLAGKLPAPCMRGAWLLLAPGFTATQWRRALKRAVDICAAAAIGIVAAPIAALTAVAVRLDSTGPALYAQERVGLDGAVFSVYKFRSMRVDAEADGSAVWAAAKDPRVTRVGRIIRRLRIDELPQLYNVIRGEMSLVGPRPERPAIVADLDQRIPYYHVRHVVRPGLTGWAQICFPYGATAEDAAEKLCYDLYYIKNWSLAFEIQIMLQTFKVMLFGRGAR